LEAADRSKQAADRLILRIGDSSQECFCGGDKKLGRSIWFLGELQTGRVSVSLTDKAEARRAASAQAPFPSRRARENKGARKGV